MTLPYQAETARYATLYIVLPHPCEVDAKAEEFIRGFKEDLRQQRLNSIFNYTQMLKQRALGGAAARRNRQPDQP